jgi:hypothetical protein
MVGLPAGDYQEVLVAHRPADRPGGLNSAAVRKSQTSGELALDDRIKSPNVRTIRAMIYAPKLSVPT